MSNSGHGNYYNMDVSMHYSNIPYGVYLPTVTFTDSNGDGLFTNTMRIAQLSAQGFTGFYEADFDGNITVIDEDAFYNDKKVCVVTINQVTDICGNAFKDCSNLRAVTLDTAVDTSHKYKLENIHEGAFENCSALKQIFIPGSVTSIPNSVFKGCVSLEVAVMGYGIPRNSVNGSIGANAFENCTSLTYFYIPETVTSVGADAFKNCSSLESLYIDDSVSSIGTGAFTTISSGCIVYVENDTTAYPDNLFPTNATKRRFKVVTVNHNTTTLQYGDVNYWCLQHQTGTLSSTSDYWKAKCTGSFPMFGTNVFRYNSSSFMKCGNLVSISIQGSNVTQIDDQCFVDLPVFQGLYIPSNITNIYGNPNYEYSMVVNNCNECRQISFEQNSSNINIEGLDKNSHHTFSENDKLRAMIFPHRLTKLVSYMCADSYDLQLVNIFQKNAKTDLNYFYKTNHFRSANLEEIHLFVNNTTFSSTDDIFLNCANLKRIYIYNKHNATHSQINDGTTASVVNVFYVIKDSTANEIHNHSGWNLHTIFKTSVTTIPASGYDGDTNLKTITFEHGASSSLTITESAFRNTGITDGANHIKWNDRVTTIGNNAFRESELTSIIIPNNVTTIGQYAFYGNSDLDDITLHKYKNDSIDVNNIIDLGGGSLVSKVYTTDVFNNIKSDATFTLFSDEKMDINPDSGTVQFKYRYQIIDGTTSIAANEFKDRTDLLSIDISNSVTTIGNNAFDGTTNMTSCSLPTNSSFTTIPDYCFQGSGLTSIDIPDSVTTINTNAFDGTTNMTSCSLPTNSSFTTIPEFCFQGSGLNSITIPDSVTIIGTNAFDGTTNMTSCDLPNNTSFTTIPNNCFQYSGLSSIDIPDSVIIIGNSAFLRTTNMTSCTLPNNTSFTTIPDNCFYRSGLTSIDIPDSVTTIGTSAFFANWNMTSCTLPNNYNFTTIPEYCFTNSALTSIIIPVSVTTIGNYAFKGNWNMTSIDIPDSVTTIGNYAFYLSSQLATVTIGNSVTSIGSNAFNETGLTSIILPDGVTLIGDGAFRNCSNLKSFKLPNNPNFTTIPDRCFEGSLNWDSPQSIPHSVNTIGINAFYSVSTLNNPAYLKLPPTFKDYVPYYQGTNVSETIINTNTSTFSTDKGLILVYNHLANYVVKNNTSHIFAIDRTGTASNQLDFLSSYTINENNNNSSGLQYFRKGILKNNYDYNTTNASTLNTAYTNSPYAAAGPIGYKINGMDIGKRIAPYYKVYTSNTNNVKLIPGWTKVGLFVIGGGGGGGSGGVYDGNGPYMGAGSGGATGGIGFGILNKSDFDTLTEMNIVIGSGGSGGAKHGSSSAANGRKGVAGNHTYITSNTGTELIKGWGGGSGTGGFAYIYPDYWDWTKDLVRGEYWDTSDGSKKTNTYNFSGGKAGEVTCHNNVTLYTNVGSSEEGEWADAIPQVSITGSNVNEYGRLTGMQGGNITNNLNILNETSYGNGGNGGNEGSNDGYAGQSGIAVVFQYFT